MWMNVLMLGKHQKKWYFFSASLVTEVTYIWVYCCCSHMKTLCTIHGLPVETQQWHVLCSLFWLQFLLFYFLSFHFYIFTTLCLFIFTSLYLNVFSECRIVELCLFDFAYLPFLIFCLFATYWNVLPWFIRRKDYSRIRYDQLP